MPHFFHAQTSLAVQLIALVAGLFLLNKACSAGFFCKKTGKFFGGLVVILSLLLITCTLYLSIGQCCRYSLDKAGEGMMGQYPAPGAPAESNK